ncbi:MAG: WXG100 family type VII secretion target [Actinobacteria bacterium]|nr:WXG100 family type VII secretion target [Actinomycetota bacterium]
MGLLKVSPEQLQAMSSTVARTSAENRSANQALTSSLSPLVGSDWTGTAATQFAALYEQYDRGARSMADALDGIGQLLSRAGSAYAEVEQQITASFR